MSFLSDLIDKAKGLLEQPQGPPTQTEAIKRNSFDRDDWRKVREQAPMVQDQITELDQTVDYVEDFMGDLHATFFKIDPKVRPEAEIKPSHAANRAVIEQLLEMNEVQNLRQHSKGDAYGSAMAMGAMGEVVRETLSKTQQAAKESAEAEQRAREDAAAQAQAMRELMEQLAQQQAEAQAAGEQGDPGGEGAGALQAQMDQFAQARQAQQQAQAQAHQEAGQAAQGMSNQVRMAAKAATEQLDEEAQLMQAFGVDPGKLQRMDVRERMTLAQALRNNRLAKFAKLLGQFRMVQQAESRKRVVNAASEVHGVTFGSDLNRMTPGEMLNFADPSLQTLLWQRWAEGTMLQYDVRGKENLGQGPIVLVCDESGSMGAEDVAGGTREAWSKALALALCDQARRRKRDFVYIGFSNAAQQHTIEFPRGEAAMDKVIAMTEHFFGGGTDYERPLTQALEIVDRFAAQGKARPDIVMVTDDCYGAMDSAFMNRWNAVKDKTSLRCYGVAIGCATSGALQQISDNVRQITEIANDPRSMGDLFRTL